MKINDAVLGVVFGVLALAILVHVRSFPSLPGQPYGPSTFPAVIAAALLLCAVGLVVRGVRARRETGLVRIVDWMKTPAGLLRMLSVPLFVVLYVWLTPVLGFPIVAPALLFAAIWGLHGRPLVSAAVAVAMSAFLWVAFSELLLVPLPLGVLEQVVY